MSWHFLLELAAEFSEPTCSDGAPLQRSKLTGIAKKFSSKGRETVCCHCSRSGMTSEPLTGNLSVEKWIASLPDSLANPSQLPESSAVPTTTATCGPRLSESFARCDLLSDFWKMFPDSWESTDTSEPYCDSWPKSGMLLDGVAYLRPPLAPITNANACGSLLPTPTVCGNYQNKDNMIGLATAVKLWPSPRASDGSHGGRVTPRKTREGGNLIEEVSRRMWPTPTSRDHKDGSAESCKNVPVNGLLGRAVHQEFYPTPRANKPEGYSSDRFRPTLAQMATGQAKPVGGQLNPTWVEWLMGWPLGWTALEPLEMDKFREWLEQHGSS